MTPTSPQPSTAPSTQPAIAIIGSGYWGKNLVRNYHGLGALKLICDKTAATLDAFQTQYPGIETCMAVSDVVTRTDIAGVVIATPAETHYPIAREALLAGSTSMRKSSWCWTKPKERNGSPWPPGKTGS